LAPPAQEWADSFGALLARLRHEHRLTQEQLADRSGLSARAISSLECGSRRPRRLTVERLAAAMSLSAHDRDRLVEAATQERWRGPTRPGHSSVSDRPLIGRDQETAALQAHLRGDGPPLLVYRGELGVGKSRMLAEAASIAAGWLLPVLAAQGRQGSHPYAPIIDALAQHARDLPAPVLRRLLHTNPRLPMFLPELAESAQSGDDSARPAPEHHRRLAFDAASRFLHDVAAGTGHAVLLLDDMQWAGPPAVDLLADLVRQAGRRLRVAMTVQAGGLSPASPLARCVGDLARQGLARHHLLTPLTASEADRLVTSVAGDAAVLRPAVRAETLRRAGGLPLFLVELTTAAAAAGGGSAPLPAHLRISVRQQLADLPVEAQALLQRLALTGDTAPIEQLATRVEPMRAALDMLELAVLRRVLDETETGFRFRYPLVREVLTTGMGPTRRRLLRAVAEAWAAGHANPPTDL
jgi:transcriptional regulator with XRE-family HTH domain